MMNKLLTFEKKRVPLQGNMPEFIKKRVPLQGNMPEFI